jgi:lipoprotein NlpI
MRVLLCLIAALSVAVPLSAPAYAAKAKKHAEPAKPVDTRPRLKRDDTMGPVATAPAGPVKKRAAHRKPRGGAPAAPVAATDGAKPAKANPRDVAACTQGKVADATIAGCTAVIEDKRTKPKGRAGAYYNRGNAYAQKGEHDKAIADFDEAIKLNPKNASAYNNRGSSHSESGDADAAIADFDAAIKINRRYASAYINRANAYAAKGERERAIKDYDAALKLNRRNVNAYIARGALQLAAGAMPKALADMKQAAALGHKNAYAVLWLDIAQKRAKQKGVLIDAKSARGLDMKAWPAPVIRLYTGEIKPDELLAAADNPSPAVKTAQVCEANFYGGEHALIGGDKSEAVKLFQTAARDCPHGFLEGIAAAEELKGLGEKVGAN